MPKTAIISATSGKEIEAKNKYWLLVASGSAMVVIGWFLPWFVSSYSGVGYSPMDVVVSVPQGIAEVGVYVMAACMLAVVVLILLERFLREPVDRRAIWRAGLSGLGLVAALVVWSSADIFKIATDFGSIKRAPITNSAVWMTFFGYATLFLTFSLRGWVRRHPNVILAIVAGLFAVLFPFMFHQAVDLIYWAAADLAIYTLLGLGLNVVVGFAGLLDLGYAAFFAIGAYTCASFASPAHNLHWPFWIIIFVGAAVASLFGAILGAPTLRLRGDYLAIVTLGFGEIVPDLATNNVFNVTGGPNGISNIDPTKLPNGALFQPQHYYWALLLMVALSIIALRNLERSRIGRAWVALREDEVAAAATGINTTSTKLLAFSIGASVSGFAGAFYGAMISIVSPTDFGFSVSVTVLSAVVLGGLGNITGVLIGAFTLTFIIYWALPNMQDWMTTFGSHTGATFLGNIHYSDYTFVVYGLALIGTMLIRPGGILPSRARRVEFAKGISDEAVSDVVGTT